MARTTAFDPDQILQQAMQLFWQHGYEATSMQRLVEGLGINRFSIYNSFGDKQTLFHMVLKRYREQVLVGLVAPLQQVEAGVPEIINYFRQLQQWLNREGDLGCLLQNSVHECGIQDAEVRRLGEQLVNDLQQGFESALKQSQAIGELNSMIDTGKCASFLLATMQGLIFLRKSGADKRLVIDAVDFLEAQVGDWQIVDGCH